MKLCLTWTGFCIQMQAMTTKKLRSYTPVICPNKNRRRGHYRKRARKFITKEFTNHIIVREEEMKVYLEV